MNYLLFVQLAPISKSAETKVSTDDDRHLPKFLVLKS